MTIALAQANLAIPAALAEATALGATISVSVCDDSHHLIAHQRMDGAMADTSRASIGKAMVAAAFGTPSEAHHPRPTTSIPPLQFLPAKFRRGQRPADCRFDSRIELRAQ